MAIILKYNLINPAIDKKKPYYDEKTKTLKFQVKSNYRYFIQATQINQTTHIKEYFLLLGTEKFDDACKKCQTNQYGKCSVPLSDEFKEFVIEECKERGNIIVEYTESDEGYDAYNVR